MDWGNAFKIAAPYLGKILSGGAKSSADARAARNSDNIYRDRTQLESVTSHERALQDRARLEMEQRQMDAATREQAYQQALRSQYLQNWSPAQRPKGVEMVRGGFNTIPDSARGTAAEMERQALLRLMNGEQFAPMPAMERFRQTPEAKESTLSKIGGLLGLGLTGYGEIAKLYGRGSAPVDGSTWYDNDAE